MSAYLHQIFYADKTFDITEESIAALEKWAVVRSSMKTHTKPTFADPPSAVDVFFGIQEEVLPTKSPKVPDTISALPKPFQEKTRHKLDIKTTTVFWCMFIAHYGYDEYVLLSGNRLNNRELEEKQKIMETLSKNPKQLKDGSMRLTHDGVQEILSILMTSSNHDFMELVAYSMYYKKTVVVEFDCAYLVYSPEKTESSVLDARTPTKDTIILKRKPSTRGTGKERRGYYSLDMEPTPEKLEQIRESKVALEHYAKPFRGVSTYKMSELEEMAKKVLGDTPNTKLKKGELYAAIVEKCCEPLL